MESPDQSRVGGLTAAVNDDTAEGEADKTLTSPRLHCASQHTFTVSHST